MTTPEPNPAPTRRWKILFVLIALAYLYPFPYWAHLNNPNENVRIYQTIAIAEDGHNDIGQRIRKGKRYVDIDGPVARYGYVNDKAVVCFDDFDKKPPCEGLLYPAKAPGLSYVGVPPYWAFHQVASAVSEEPPPKVAIIYFMRLTCGIIPCLIFLWFLRAYIRRETESDLVADLLAVAYGLGSLSFTYGLLYTGHQQAALALGGAFLAFEAARRRDRAWLLVLGGFLLAGAPVIEYPAALPGVLVGVYSLRAPSHWKRYAWVILGAIGPIIGFFLYHWHAFGGPLATSYDHMENLAFRVAMADGYQGFAGPNLDAAGGMLFAPATGLFFFATWLALFFPGVWYLWRHKRRWTVIAIAGGTLAGLTFGSSLSEWRYMLGWTMGPRYVTHIIPLMAIGSAWGMKVVIERWGTRGTIAVAGLVLLALMMTGLPSVLLPHTPSAYSNPTFQLHLPLLLQGLAPRSAGHLVGLSGFWALLPWILIALAAWGVAVYPRGETTRSATAWRLAAPVGIAAALFFLASLPGMPATDKQKHMTAWFAKKWEPAAERPEVAPKVRPKRGPRPGPKVK